MHDLIATLNKSSTSDLFAFLQSLSLPSSFEKTERIRILYPGEGQTPENILQEATAIVNYFSNQVAYGSTAESDAIIYLALTPIAKKQPRPGSAFNESNINTGFTQFPSKCIFVYRFQEWQKVLFHELFHWAGCEVRVDIERPLVLHYSGGKEIPIEDHGWTESLVEWNASMLFQEYQHHSSSSWQETYAKSAARHLRSMLSVLLSTTGPETKEFGPEYLLLKYWFWSHYSSSLWTWATRELRSQAVPSLSSLFSKLGFPSSSASPLSLETLNIPSNTSPPAHWLLEWNESRNTQGGRIKKRRRQPPLLFLFPSRRRNRHRDHARSRKRNGFRFVSKLVRRK